MGHELTFPRSVCSGSIPLSLSLHRNIVLWAHFVARKVEFSPHKYTQNPTQNDLGNLIFNSSHLISTLVRTIPWLD
jgi:hypothetical protein